MPEEAPDWQVHLASGYDGAMTARCDRLLGEIVADPGRRKSILADPRELHRELFASFTPAAHPEYAGTYRGTPDTALADVRMSAGSQIDPEVVYEFCPPREVPWLMTELRVNTRSLLNVPDQDDYDKLIALAYTFCRFGKIHPFIDGNGPVQRAVFAVMATEFDFPLSPRFAIHPRPFDRLLAAALELFGRAPADEEQEELGLVAVHFVKAPARTGQDLAAREKSRSRTPSLTAMNRRDATAKERAVERVGSKRETKDGSSRSARCGDSPTSGTVQRRGQAAGLELGGLPEARIPIALTRRPW